MSYGQKPICLSLIFGLILELGWPGFVRAANPSTGTDSYPSASSPSHVIQSGDALYFSVSPAEELSRDVTVDENGRISVPLIGAISVAGRTVDELARSMTQALSKYVSNPKIDILVKTPAGKQIFVMGQVRAPGSYPYRPHLRLLDAVSMAGGFQPGAEKGQIHVFRGSGPNRRTLVVNVGEALVSGDASKDFPLEPGDLVEVPSLAHALTIFGEVEHGGVFDYVAGMRLLDLISLAQGFKEGANLRRIKIFRGQPPNQTVMNVRFSDALNGKMKVNIPLQAGDVVYIPRQSVWSYSAYANLLIPFTSIILSAATVYLAVNK